MSGCWQPCCKRRCARLHGHRQLGPPPWLSLALPGPRFTIFYSKDGTWLSGAVLPRRIVSRDPQREVSGHPGRTRQHRYMQQWTRHTTKRERRTQVISMTDLICIDRNERHTMKLAGPRRHGLARRHKITNRLVDGTRMSNCPGATRWDYSKGCMKAIPSVPAPTGRRAALPAKHWRRPPWTRRQPALATDSRLHPAQGTCTLPGWKGFGASLSRWLRVWLTCMWQACSRAGRRAQRPWRETSAAGCRAHPA